MKVYFPSRFIDRHVGGNSTYAMAIRHGIEARGVETALIPAGSSPIRTMVTETSFGLRRELGSVLHYTGDTGPLIRTRTPSVVTVHGVSSKLSPSSRNTLQQAIWNSRVKAALRSCDAVITVSHTSAEEIFDAFKVDRSKISVIHHGVDANRFATPQSLSPQLAHAISSPFVLYLGNLEPKKNLVELMRGYRISGLHKEGVALVIAGKPAWGYEPVLEEMRLTPGVMHLGFVSDNDRVALMQMCTMFIFPSLYEGFGFPVLEALAAGAVVASTRRGALAEIAGPSLAIEDIDADAIAESILRGVKDADLRHRIQTQSAEWVSKFSWDQSIDRHLSVYQEVSDDH